MKYILLIVALFLAGCDKKPDSPCSPTICHEIGIQINMEVSSEFEKALLKLIEFEFSRKQEVGVADPNLVSWSFDPNSIRGQERPGWL